MYKMCPKALKLVNSYQFETHMHSRSPYDIKEVHVRAQNLSTVCIKLILSENVFISTFGGMDLNKSAKIG